MASIESFMFSSSSGKPSSSPCTTLSSQPLAPGTVMISPLGFSRPIIHFTACICGSMMSGKRAHMQMIAAFCVESGSAGSPSAFHPAVFEASVSSAIGSKFSVIGMERVTASGRHFSLTSWSRNSRAKGAMYATNDDESSTSPTSSRIFSSRAPTSFVQRTPSLDRPLTRRLARLARFCVASALATSSFFSLVAVSSCSESCAILALIAATCARTLASFLLAAASSASAAASLARFGATSR
mmetsp:Transcript_33640/g.92175  ORF Transcript_33640/g.92175 Transcript_33640/m.92175 type:complete len:241 (-) Transcript_33640:1875-2597(-)